MQIYATDGTEAGAMPSGTGVIGQFSQSKLEETKTYEEEAAVDFLR